MFRINGMEENDVGALTPEQQQQLNEFKVTFLTVKRKLSRDVSTILPIYYNFSFMHRTCIFRSIQDLETKDT